MTLGKSLQNICLELLLAITIAKRRIWANDAVSPTKKIYDSPLLYSFSKWKGA